MFHMKRVKKTDFEHFAHILQKPSVYEYMQVPSWSLPLSFKTSYGYSSGDHTMMNG